MRSMAHPPVGVSPSFLEKRTNFVITIHSVLYASIFEENLLSGKREEHPQQDQAGTGNGVDTSRIYYFSEIAYRLVISPRF